MRFAYSALCSAVSITCAVSLSCAAYANTVMTQDLQSHDYYLQLGSFAVKANADRLRDATQRKTHYPVTAERGKKYYVVKVGPLQTAQEVTAVQHDLATPISRLLSVNTSALAVNTPVSQPVVAMDPPQTPHIYKDGNLALASGVNGNGFIAAYVGIQHPNTDSHFTVDNGSGYPAPYNVDSYSRVLHTSANAALEAGYRWFRHQFFVPSYAVSFRYEHTFVNDIGDQITQYSLPEFTNYTYTWDLASDILLAIAKVNLVEWHHLMPYVSGGIGAAFNRASNYTETALPGVTARYSAGYTDLTTTRFAYHLGAGFDWQALPQLIVSLGYDYQNLGNVPSGQGVASWAGLRLVTSKYSTNAVMLGFNYFINMPTGTA